MRILYVEDDAQIAGVAKFLFLKTHHELVFCTTVSDAIKIISLCRKKIDLIILDINLPEVNGVELLRHLDKKSISIPVIVTTGYYREHEMEIVPYEKTRQVCYVLHKPFSTFDLLDTIEKTVKCPIR